MVLTFRSVDSVRCTAWRLFGFSLPGVFIVMFATKPVRSETDKQNGCQVPTMVLSEARGL